MNIGTVVQFTIEDLTVSIAADILSAQDVAFLTDAKAVYRSLSPVAKELVNLCDLAIFFVPSTRPEGVPAYTVLKFMAGS